MMYKNDTEKQSLFTQQMMAHIDALYRFALRLTTDADQANDLVQDTYLKAYRFFDSFQEGTNAKAWLFRIMKNSFINDYRKQARTPKATDVNKVNHLIPAKAASVEVEDLNLDVISNLVGDEILDALNKLDDDYRTVILLCDIEEFKYEEMAEILEIPIGTVRSRIHRARHLLRQYLQDYAKETGYIKS